MPGRYGGGYLDGGTVEERVVYSTLREDYTKIEKGRNPINDSRGTGSKIQRPKKFFKAMRK